MAGNPNPSPATRFGPGNKANPGGKTKAQKAIEIEAAIMAAKLRHAILSAMTEKLADITDATELLTADALRLMKDSEDRAFGTAKQSVDHSSEDGSMTPHVIEHVIVRPDLKNGD